MRRTTIEHALVTVFVGVALCGCAKEASEPHPEPGASPLTIGWIDPQDGESIADTIRCALGIEGGTPYRVDILSGEKVASTRSVGPWTLQWLPADTLATPFRLKAVAHGPDSSVSASPEIQIAWSPNLPPIVRLEGSPGPVWLERTEGEVLEAEAFDPEDGQLVGDAVTWFSDRQGLLGSGTLLPVTALIPGPHVIRVRATDQWRRSAWARIDAEVFRWTGGSTPETCLEDLRYSLLDRRPDRYASLLPFDFRFVFCPSERAADPAVPPYWTRSEEEAFAQRIATSFTPVRASWVVASLLGCRLDGEDGMKAEIRDIGFVFVDAAGETLAVHSGAARIYLRREQERSAWLLRQWQDLGSDGPLSQGRLRLRVASGQAVSACAGRSLDTGSIGGWSARKRTTPEHGH